MRGLRVWLIVVMVLTLASPVLAGDWWPPDWWPPDPGGQGSAPEINPAAISGGIALLAGGILVIRSRRRK